MNRGDILTKLDFRLSLLFEVVLHDLRPLTLEDFDIRENLGLAALVCGDPKQFLLNSNLFVDRILLCGGHIRVIVLVGQSFIIQLDLEILQPLRKLSLD